MIASRGASKGRDAPSGVRSHIPVLLSQVLSELAPKAGEIYIDATFGAGGYSAGILASADCRVLALDRDGMAVRAAVPLCEHYPGRLTVVRSVFSAMSEVWCGQVGRDMDGGCDVPKADGIVFDVGVSSMQLDQPERGFSFMTDGPLDMRMGQEGASAADILNTASETELANILWRFGDERRSRAIARAIVQARGELPFVGTLEFAKLIEKVIGRKPGDPQHPATRSFQALRIAVNRELDELSAGLLAAENLLKPGGRLVAVTFHSLEDRIVKDFLRNRSERAARGSRHKPQEQRAKPTFRIVNQRALSPTEDEIDRNPRARSAKLRAAIRTEAPPPDQRVAQAP